MIIGVAGQAGSGKTTVTRILEQHGYEILNADNIAKELYKKPDASTRGEINVYEAVLGAFGAKRILGEGGEVDRVKLGKIVFNDPVQMKRLNKIMFPALVERIYDDIDHLYNDKIVIDGAVLLNTALIKVCHLIIVVQASKDVRIKRLIERGVNKKIAPKMADAVKISISPTLSIPVVLFNNDGDVNQMVWNFRNLLEISC